MIYAVFIYFSHRLLYKKIRLKPGFSSLIRLFKLKSRYLNAQNGHKDFNALYERFFNYT